MTPDSTVCVAGHAGLVGSAFSLVLHEHGYRVMTIPCGTDLRERGGCGTIRHLGPDVMVLAAAYVGGLPANVAEPERFLVDNLKIQINVMEGARAGGARQLLFLGSSCVYPRIEDRALREEDLFGGALEETNRAYALAKLAGIEHCRILNADPVCAMRCTVLMPPNLHGSPERDRYGARAHVLQGLLERMCDAKDASAGRFEIWGSGRPRREFMRAEEIAQAGVFLLEREGLEHDVYNVGYGYDVAVRALAELVADRVGYRGALVQDESVPDGTFQKTLDPTRLRRLGWAPSASMFDGIEKTCGEYLAHRYGS